MEGVTEGKRQKTTSLRGFNLYLERSWDTPRPILTKKARWGPKTFEMKIKASKGTFFLFFFLVTSHEGILDPAIVPPSFLQPKQETK